jgi:integrase/recombinase XerD
MKNGKVSVKVLPDSRRTKSKGRLPLKLRITYKGERKYYGTGFDASSEDWAIINSAGAKGDLRRVKNDIAEVEKKAQECAGRIAPFSFKQFERDFYGKSIRFESLQSAFDVVVGQLESEDRWGTASSYRTACNALDRFKAKISLEDVDREFLQKFENWAVKEVIQPGPTAEINVRQYIS